MAPSTHMNAVGSVRGDRCRCGVLLTSRFPPDELVALASLTEGLGFGAIWYPDEKFYRDPYVGLTLIARATSRVILGTCVTDPYSRHPMLTAAAAASLAEVAPGRTVIGLGAGGRGFAAMGLRREKPAIALREVIPVLRSLLRGEPVTAHGKVIHVDGGLLDFPPPQGVPIYIGAGHGELVLRLAGEMADGVFVHSYASPPGIRKALTTLEAGARRGERSLDAVWKIARVDIAVGNDRRAARTVLAPQVLSALRASYPDLQYLAPYPDLTVPPELRQVLELTQKDDSAKRHYYNPAHAAPLIPSAFIDHLAVGGTVQEVVVQLRSILESGMDALTFRPVPLPGVSLTETLRTLAESVVPGVVEK